LFRSLFRFRVLVCCWLCYRFHDWSCVGETILTMAPCRPI
jgi:hypothetical protein